MSNLLSCPFCGGDAEFDRLGTGHCSSIVVCQECGCRVESNEVGDFNGDHWNRRVSVSAKEVYSVFCPLQVTDGFNCKPTRLSIRLARLRWRLLCLLGLRNMGDW